MWSWLPSRQTIRDTLRSAQTHFPSHIPVLSDLSIIDTGNLLRTI